jgi:hypothetical protein
VAVNPIANPEAYDRVTIGGVTWGLCKVNGWGRKHEFDVKKGKGTIGSTITFVGRPPAKGTIKFYLYRAGADTGHDVDDWQRWDQEFAPALQYDPTKTKVQPVDIYSPFLARLRITSVVTESIGTEEDEGGKKWFIPVDFLEFFPAPAASAVSTPDGSKGGFSSGHEATPQTADDVQQAQLAALIAEARK